MTEDDTRPADLDAAVGELYQELRQVALRAMRRERHGHTLQPTALVNEAYLRLQRQRRAGWENEQEFLAVAAKIMRRVLVDHARRHQAGKRGGDFARVTLDLGLLGDGPPSADVLTLHDALEALSEIDERAAKVVELRFFGGLEVEEAGRVLDISNATVKRDWTFAKAWLLARMRDEDQ